MCDTELPDVIRFREDKKLSELTVDTFSTSSIRRVLLCTTHTIGFVLPEVRVPLEIRKWVHDFSNSL